MVGIHLAGIDEWAVVMHTDCGAVLAWEKINSLVDNLARVVDGGEGGLRGRVDDSAAETLREDLLLFKDPRSAVVAEVERIRAMPFVGPDIMIHGLVLDLSSGTLELVVDGSVQVVRTDT